MRQIINLAVIVFALATGLFTISSPIISSGTGITAVRSTFVCTPLPIAISDTVNGVLESGDCVDTNTTLYDGYTFSGTAGEKIDIALGSEAYAASLRLVQGNFPGGNVIATGVAAENGRRRITGFTIPASGIYTIVAGSAAPGVTGAYTLSLEPNIPRVDLIQRTSANPALPGTVVGFSVFFSSAVTGVDASDFTLVTNGLSAASITSVSGEGSIYSVALNTGTGAGSLRLDLVDNDTITNVLGMPLGGVGGANGNFTTGPSYSVAASTPTPSPTPPPSTIQVTNTDDEGPGSLRQAIADVAFGGTVTFSPFFSSPRTIRLTEELRILKNVTITGPGPSLLTVSGNNAVRIFNIGGFSSGFTVAISGVTMTEGRAPMDDFGGAIEKNFGELTLSNCVVSNSHANGTGFGTGGIGGGIDNFQGPLTISGCRISGNTANGRGGGVQSEDGNLTIRNSTISGNSSRRGGGIDASNSSVIISDTTVDSNRSEFQGSGIAVQNSTFEMSNSTVSGNSPIASTSGGASIVIVSTVGSRTARLSNCTVANNTTLSGSGGIGGFAITGGDVTINLRSSIIANNSEPNLTTQNNSFASIISQGFNMTNGGGNGFLNHPTDKVNAEPGLGPLTDNGGLTRTHALFANSAAIDAGSSFGLTSDQRGSGFSRIVDLSAGNAPGGDGADIGAFEAQTEPGPAFATIGGRVFTPSGLSLRNATMILTDPQGVRRTAVTSPFGVFSFQNIPTGQTYILAVSSKRYRFGPRSLMVGGDLASLDFTGLE